MNKRIQEYSVFLVVVQMACLIFLFVTTPSAIYKSLFLIPFEFLSFLILSWAMLSLNSKTISIFPVIRKNAVFSFRGPYKTVRHPMYLSILVLAVPLLFAHFTFIRLIVILILTIILFMKIEVEEQLLRKKYPGYCNYSRRTYRIIPYIY